MVTTNRFKARKMLKPPAATNTVRTTLGELIVAAFDTLGTV
jgi:hypothetical protein